MKKILVLSDSHGNVNNMVTAVRNTHPDQIIHLGDCWVDAEKLHQQFPMIMMEQVPGNCDCSQEPVERILEAVHNVLERTPPELVADISTNGIVMTGGGSLVSGFDKLVTARTGIHTVIADDAISCVALGTGKSLDSLNAMQDGTMNLSRRKQMN